MSHRPIHAQPSPVGGRAWSGRAPIARVEVSVDDGRTSMPNITRIASISTQDRPKVSSSELNGVIAKRAIAPRARLAKKLMTL